MTDSRSLRAAAVRKALGAIAVLLCSCEATAWVVRADTPPTHLDTLPPSVLVTRAQPSPTSADRVSFGVAFSESVGDTFTALDVRTTTGSLEANLQVRGATDAFTVDADLNDQRANGVIAIQLTGEITDAFLNPVENGLSPEYTIYNWPGFSEHPQGERVYTGGSHTLGVAAAFGGVAHTFEWYRSRSGAVTALGINTGAMTIDPVAPEDSGDYWCRVDFEGIPYDSNTAMIEVADHLSMATPPQGGRSYAGDTRTFTPVLSGGFAPLQYTWRKGAALVGTDPSYTLSSVTMSDAGWYHVSVSDALTDHVSAGPIGLEVAPRIAILSEPADMRRYEGESATLYVQAAGGFAPLACTWSTETGALASGFTLELTALAQEDSGPYWATVNDSFMDRAASNTMALEVRPHLRITSQPQGATVNEGEAHSFTVAVEGGFIPYTFTWMHDDRPIGVGQVLALSNLAPIAEGNYTVQVEDDNGDVVVSSVAVLEVLAAPLPALVKPGLAGLSLLIVVSGLAMVCRQHRRQ